MHLINNTMSFLSIAENVECLLAITHPPFHLRTSSKNELKFSTMGSTVNVGQCAILNFINRTLYMLCCFLLMKDLTIRFKEDCFCRVGISPAMMMFNQLVMRANFEVRAKQALLPLSPVGKVHFLSRETKVESNYLTKKVSLI